MEPDFAGYVTKAGLKCSDGRTIQPEAFKHMDGQIVPLVWQHGHDNPENVLGHVRLEAREDGVYGYGFFNETPAAIHSKGAVDHKDINMMSIYANQLVERSKQVFHGFIREVSLVLSGANPGALIDYVRVAHSDGSVDTLENEAVIYTGLEFAHAQEEGTVEHADGKTVQDVYDGMTDEQKEVLHFMVGTALEEAAAGEVKQSGIEEDSETTVTGEEVKDEGDLAHQEGSEMTQNVFETNGAAGQSARPSLSHDQLKTIMDDAAKFGSIKESFLAHAVDYGIENIDFLFPDAKTIDNKPEFVSRRMEWVSSVLSGAKKNPFSRIKTISADITWDEARAKGYVKGDLKKEEWFGLTKRITTPTTIYKKQKLDRDDIIDITDLDVVAWIKGEMRLMLDEEIARVILIGDGREVDDDDKVNESNIRPIAYDDEFYTHKVTVAAGTTGDALVDAVVTARENYRGSGNPTLFTTESELTKLLLVKDGQLRRLYPTVTELASAMRVSNIVTVPVLEGRAVGGAELLFVLVDMSDYTIGADNGGNVGLFDDFDIDYNQYKYLIETRISGALTKFKSALVVVRSTTSGAVTPNDPTFVPATGVLTIVATTGVVYKNAETNATLSTGAQTAIAAGASVRVKATPAAGYNLANNAKAAWLFTRDA